MDATFIQQIQHGNIMDDDGEEESLGSLSSLSRDSSRSSSSSDDFTEDTASSGPLSSSSSDGPLFEMSNIKDQLPFKRGLSKFYQGKSQSFTSFSEIRCIEDLAKPERPLKRLKASKSCGEGLDSKRSLPLKSCINGRAITKKCSKSSLSSSINRRRNCLLGSKPPLYPHRPSNLNDHHQTFWFA